jgi:hypothetical protein
MTPQEKILYHQIHPLKLFTDISAEFVSLYLFWRHKLIAGLVAMFVPPIIASLLIIKLVNLETYKQSTFGWYIRSYMTPSVVIVRVLGTVVTHVGAWYRIPTLIPLGLIIVLLGWLRGILWPKRPQVPGPWPDLWKARKSEKGHRHGGKCGKLIHNRGG